MRVLYPLGALGRRNKTKTKCRERLAAQLPRMPAGARVALLSSIRAALVELFLTEVPQDAVPNGGASRALWVKQSSIHRPRISNQK